MTGGNGIGAGRRPVPGNGRRPFDPRAKLLLTIVATACVLHVQAPAAVFALVALGFAGVCAVRPGRAKVVRALGPFVAGLFVLLVFYAVRLDGSGDIRVAGWVGVSTPGLVDGLVVVGRFLAVALAATLVGLTTGTDRLAGALVWLLGPLHRVRVPVDDVATGLALALRMVPAALAQARSIADAMRARGVDVGSGGPLAAVRSWVPVAVPLVVGLFRRSEAVADAMRARCYRGRGRTRMDESGWAVRDLVLLCVGFASLVAVAALL